jgi:CcmD family protein
MIYMAGAYVVIWAASFIFILSMVRRQAKLDSELQMLREIAQDRSNKA